MSLAEIIELLVIQTEPGIAQIISDVSISHSIHRDHNSRIVKIVPQASICRLVPAIKRESRMCCRGHYDCIQVVISEQFEVRLCGLGTADVQVEEALECICWCG